jgi:Skp family chaperone for outer membrane proteins
MVKKGLIIGVAALVLLGLFFGRDAASYVKTSVGWIHQGVHDAVPVEFELSRARQMIKDLDPEIQRNMHLIAKEEVEVQHLRGQLGEAETSLTKNRSDIERLNVDLKRGDSNFVYCGKTYTSKQVESDLTRRFESFKVKEATLGKLTQILAARERGLDAGREKLKAMQSAKGQLEVDVENMEARLEMVKVAQSTSEFAFDDSRLSRTKELCRDIAARIDVAEKLVNAETTYPGQINLDEEETGTSISDQVTAYFNASQKADESVAVKLDVE